ncbi:uncharacterized protein LOC128735498 [Sabethes cyaneus]|uniref:uncharacterized protein LOC128735498 n=1 Tax=Sabethes cyaneus TaxID=53552 RepID=UPI00237EA766|nr:uncharacterized protein LOC128735498 [Sabethes cyaneus]XP_053685963.1 uncharacterized protein LOC128735498 [Sabethes cyaneus]
MRNCFIPKCDLVNKHNPKRAMFNVPIKDAMLFAQWQAVLPNHRPLKEFDRICENHFAEEDILRYWEHTINGKIERMERKKPALKPNAVPVYVDSVSVDESFNSSSQKNQMKVLQESIDVPQAKKIKTCQTDSSEVSVTSTINLSVQTIPESLEGQEIEHNTLMEAEQSVHPEFEMLYDDVYEVELPSTLWGIHRDTEKKFIAFTEFNKDTMNTRKYLFIDQRLEYRMAVGQRIMKKGILSEACTVDISNLLSELEDIQVRKIIVKGSSSVLKET